MKIDLNKVARKIEVDNRIPLRNYYRIADNLLRQVCFRYRDGDAIPHLNFTLDVESQFMFKHF